MLIGLDCIEHCLREAEEIEHVLSSLLRLRDAYCATLAGWNVHVLCLCFMLLYGVLDEADRRSVSLLLRALQNLDLNSYKTMQPRACPASVQRSGLNMLRVLMLGSLPVRSMPSAELM